MALHRSKHGLGLPITGQPRLELGINEAPESVALLGEESIGLKPTMLVQLGDSVRAGQKLFEDKKNPGVFYTSAFGGTVESVNRGERRAFRSLVITVDHDLDPASFAAYQGKAPSELTRDQVRDLLVESGEWTALRSRPFGRVAAPNSLPDAILVNCMDSQPLAADPLIAIAGREEDLKAGLEMLAKLTDGPLYVTTEPGVNLDLPQGDQIRPEQFSGPHPAGTCGYQIHRLAPVDRQRTVFYLDAQEAVAIGHLGRTGNLDSHRVISYGGPAATDPRLLRIARGASVTSVTGDGLDDEQTRTIAGSVLSGRGVADAETAFLGRFDRQISVLSEDRERKFLGWMKPGGNVFSVTNAFASTLTPGKRFAMTTSTNGSPRAIVPIGLYEKVSPFDFEPTFLLKAIVMEDIERGEELGCLELVEEDVDLWSFVCPGKIDYRHALRSVLTELEKDG